MPASDAGETQSAILLARAAITEGQTALRRNDAPAALRWFERAHRLLPHDPSATLALASALLPNDPARAARLFEDVAQAHDTRQAWLGLATARLRLNGASAAADPLGIVLSRHGFNPDIVALADHVAGAQGWCAISFHGQLETRSGRVRIELDGRVVAGRKLPGDWATGRHISVTADGRHLLGSPLLIPSIRSISGCVETQDGGLFGWAWHPRAPDIAPNLQLVYADGQTRALTARDEAVPVPDTGPLARARRFVLSANDLRGVPGPIHVRGPDGQDLMGSPVDPQADRVAQMEAALRLASLYPATGRPPKIQPVSMALASRADAPFPSAPVGADRRRRNVTVVIPVHNGGAVVPDCLDSVLASVTAPSKVLVVDDGSTDPSVIGHLDDLARRRAIQLIRHPRQLGFPAAANTGIVAARNRDVVLLNSDTLVPAGWLERLSDAAYAEPDIGTVTPLSNDASITSYPGAPGSNPVPDQATVDRLDRLAQRANAGGRVDLPVGVGFCLFIRRACLSATGSFRFDIFAQGYGEENDFCLRARSLGWRSVALTGLFVGHRGGSSFGSAAAHLRRRNSRLIERLHPGHDARIEAFLALDPLAEPRRRIDLQRWRFAGKGWRQSAVVITHNHGGGVEQRLSQAVGQHQRAGRRAVVLRPAEPGRISVSDGMSDDLPNLTFALPQELPALLRLLRSTRPTVTDVHHFLHHPPAIYDLVTQLGVPYDVHVHDYAWFCPRVSLVSGHDRYCGEPDLHECEACVEDHGHFLREEIGVAALRQRSASFLRGAARVIAPSDDTAIRMARHFPGLALVTVPHEDDAAVPMTMAVTPANGGARVCVVGGIGVHKGYNVLLACARDAARRGLDLEFVVVGNTIDDARMTATGRVFVTGRFKPDEAVAMIVAQRAQIGFVPSIWPETWCLSLGDIWRAGLPAASFDIGAPAERIRRTGRGFVLPLGLSPGAINNALVAAAGAAGRS